jgi:hypothetical protein
MIDTRDPAVLLSMLSNACAVLLDISAISGALPALAMSSASAPCRMCMRDGRGHQRAGCLSARGALHAHGARAMQDVVILETALIK